MTVSASCARASAIRNSSLRVLLPPVASPVWSSRLIHKFGPPSASLRRGIASSAVGRWARGRRGRLENIDSHPFQILLRLLLAGPAHDGEHTRKDDSIEAIERWRGSVVPGANVTHQLPPKALLEA